MSAAPVPFLRPDDPAPSPFMAEALREANAALGHTHPNPAVGAVLVRDGVIVGRGRTQPPGQAHAEVMAIRDAGDAARGATLYVTLEPCNHQGRTGPCTGAIREAGIARVVHAIPDPNPTVAGGGATSLAAAGIPVEAGDGAAAANRLLAPWLRWLRTGRPWVTAKWAMTLDGAFASRTRDSRWISSEASRERVHAVRSRVDAILVGAGTALADDPALTARPGGAPAPYQPTRVVVDSHGRLPLQAALLQQPGDTWIATVDMPGATERALRGAGATILRLDSPDGRVPLDALLDALGAAGFTSLLAEGGADIHGALLDAGLIDRVMAFIAPVLVGGAEAVRWGGRGFATIQAGVRLEDIGIETIGQDVLVTGMVPREG